jgi:hypothetical protein
MIIRSLLQFPVIQKNFTEDKRFTKTSNEGDLAHYLDDNILDAVEISVEATNNLLELQWNVIQQHQLQKNQSQQQALATRFPRELNSQSKSVFSLLLRRY